MWHAELRDDRLGCGGHRTIIGHVDRISGDRSGCPLEGLCCCSVLASCLSRLMSESMSARWCPADRSRVATALPMPPAAPVITVTGMPELAAGMPDEQCEGIVVSVSSPPLWRVRSSLLTPAS